MKFVVLGAIVALMMRGPLVQAGPTERLPIPDAPATAEADGRLKEQYKDLNAKIAPAEKRALASRLLQYAQSIKKEDRIADRYLSYVEAQRLYAEVGDLVKCFASIDECATVFATNAIEQKTRRIEALAKAATMPGEFRLLSRCHLMLADNHVQKDIYDAAEKAVQAASLAARKSGSAPSVARAVAKGKEVTDLKSQYEKTKKARETLAATPDDAAANLTLGRFQSLVKGNWEQGLPLLAKGSDAGLKSTAAKDLASPEDPRERMDLAEEWWGLGEKAPPAVKEQIRKRAVKWHELAAPKLTGLEKTKSNARILEFFQQHTIKGNWMELMEPKLWGLPPGKAGSPFQLKTGQRIDLTPFPKGEFDAMSFRFRPAVPGKLGLHIEIQNKKRAINLGHGMATLSAETLIETAWTKEVTTSFEPLPEHVLTVVLSDDEGIIFLDGREKLRFPAVVDRVDTLGILVSPVADDAFLEQIRIRRKE